MNLYHFNPNTYSATYSVMAESREAAIEAVRAHIRADVAAMTCFWDNAPDEWPDKSDPRNGQTGEQKRAEWLEDQMKQLDRYINGTPWLYANSAPAIEVYGPGQVVRGEIC